LYRLFVLQPKYRPPSHPVRRYIFKFVFSSWVDGLMMLVIILNIITMFLVHYNQVSALGE
jgi:hypothetical protein